MLIFVDDIILTGNNPSFLSSLVSQLGIEFALKDLGAVHFFLGIEVNKNDLGYRITQHKYTRDLLIKEDMIDLSSMSTGHNKSLQDDVNVDPATYSSLVGSL